MTHFKSTLLSGEEAGTRAIALDKTQLVKFSLEKEPDGVPFPIVIYICTSPLPSYRARSLNTTPPAAFHL
ncbi:MAG: hypothetical protein AAF704_17630 [Cyanobacteria bacterium P01_D01_bin.123]